MPAPEKLYLNRPHSASVLAGQADVYVVHPPPSASAILVRLRRDRYGDPLLMGGGAPPRVPRRCRVVADTWDQEAFDADAADHSIVLAAPPAGAPLYVGVHNYASHRRETCRYTLSAAVQAQPGDAAAVRAADAAVRAADAAVRAADAATSARVRTPASASCARVATAAPPPLPSAPPSAPRAAPPPPEADTPARAYQTLAAARAARAAKRSAAAVRRAPRAPRAARGSSR